MEDIQKEEELIIINTVQFLAQTREACPQFLGELKNVEDADERSTAVFNAAIVDGRVVVRANPMRLVPTIKAVALINEVALSNEGLLRVCEGVVARVGIEYGNFIDGYADDLPGLLSGSTRLH